MKYFFKPKQFSLLFEWTITDESGRRLFRIKADLFTLGNRWCIYETEETSTPFAILKNSLNPFSPITLRDSENRIIGTLKDRWASWLKIGYDMVNTQGKVVLSANQTGRYDFNFFSGNLNIGTFRKIVKFGDRAILHLFADDQERIDRRMVLGLVVALMWSGA